MGALCGCLSWPWRGVDSVVFVYYLFFPQLEWKLPEERESQLSTVVS
jgi:hypothetical protein